MSRWPDLTGKQYGRLFVERRATIDEVPANIYKNDGCRWWIARCACGITKCVNTKRLNEMSVTSCGCMAGRTKPSSESAKWAYYRHYAIFAHRRKKVFNLTLEQFLEITSKPCAYCGIEWSSEYPNYNRGDGNAKYNGAYRHNGIDRVDSSMGYVPENCVSACKSCNYAKSEMTTAQFKDWIKRVYAYLNLGTVDIPVPEGLER